MPINMGRYEDETDSRLLTPAGVLTKAIEKAHANGWDDTVQVGGYYIIDQKPVFVVEFRDRAELPWERFIYSHDFVKALWGGDVFGTLAELRGDTEPNKLLHWQYHLQQMVIADDPIKYLGEHL